MGEIVNLNRARKARKRADAQKTAAENRAAFGRPKAQSERVASQRAREARELDGKKRED